MENKVRIIAFYLPQFHPTAENDEWWGKGFTEWTNVVKTKPLYTGHYQPRIPTELGFYDLRLPEARKAQADMAREYGIEGFAYWHYWFGGRRILQRPFNEVLTSGEPDFPFCLAWANHTWTGVWVGLSDKILIEQTYPGKDDYINHFYAVLEAFNDPRYIKVENKPLFYVYNPSEIPDCTEFIQLWNSLAIDNGLEGIYFIGHTAYPEKEAPILLKMGFNAINSFRFEESFSKMKGHTIGERIVRKFLRTFMLSKRVLLNICDYKEFIVNLVTEGDRDPLFFPTIYPSWDNTARRGEKAIIMENSSPETFKIHVKKVLNAVKDKPSEKRIIFLKSWNEWAEGNYMEPDLKYGNQYLEALKSEIDVLEIEMASPAIN
jgi:hypothetical protein